jgi:hypothetical protein
MATADFEKPARVAAWVCDRLDEEGLPYALGGALALGVWGVPRGTIDVDVSVFVPQSRIDEVVNAFERAGALIDRSGVKRQLERSDLFIARVMGTRVDVFVGRHPLYAEMARRRQLVTDAFGTQRYFVSKEDLALMKLIYHRPKDLIDLERLFAVQGAKLDVHYIRSWLIDIAGAEDRRLETLADLERRFIDVGD